MDMNTAVGLLNIKEDLLIDVVSGSNKNSISETVTLTTPNGKAKQTKSTRIKTKVSTYEKLLITAVKKLGYTSGELKTWLNQTPNIPEAIKHNALMLISKYELDPFTDEIAINQYDDGQWQAFITIDGWSKLINRHPAFSGISFTESNELIGGVPTWMRCAIYRSDRVVPIEVKEYLCEIQTEHSVWKDMPRRMLRHRVIAQCARLAFGVSVPERKKGLKLVNGDGETLKIQNDCKKIVSQIEKLKINLKGKLG